MSEWAPEVGIGVRIDGFEAHGAEVMTANDVALGQRVTDVRLEPCDYSACMLDSLEAAVVRNEPVALTLTKPSGEILTAKGIVSQVTRSSKPPRIVWSFTHRAPACDFRSRY